MIRCARCWLTRFALEKRRIQFGDPYAVCCVSPYLSTEVE